MSTGPVPQVLLLLWPQLQRLQAPTGAYLMVIRSQKPDGGGAPAEVAQSRLNTPVSPATTMTARSQPAKMNPNDAQPSAKQRTGQHQDASGIKPGPAVAVADRSHVWNAPASSCRRS